MILAVDHVPGVKGEKNSEADIAVKNLLQLAPQVPGALGFICDTVFRGTHIDKLQRETGLVVLCPITAKEVNPKTMDRTEKEGYLRAETFSYPDGTSVEVNVWTVGGHLCREVYADDGTPVLVPLRRTRTFFRDNYDGTYRTY